MQVIEILDSGKVFPELKGKWAENFDIPQPKVLYSGFCNGCEDVAVSAGGKVYGSSKDGSIQMFKSLSAQSGETLAFTGGRPLGLHFDKSENL